MKKFLVALMAALTCFAFAACAPSNVEKAKAKMEEAGYRVEVSDESAAELLAGEEAVGMIVAIKGEFSLTGGADVDMISAVLFESSSAAKEYYEEHKDEAEEDQIIKRDGKWVYAGTEDAVEAFTK